VKALARRIVLGLRANWRQIVLLAAVNAFVGSMVGMERTVLPLLGSSVFGLESYAAIVSFLISFGVTKAIANAVAGRLADVHGRRRILLAGWIAGAPVPFLLAFAPPPHWWLIVLANVFLGVNQGLCWSMTLLGKLDLVGPRHRGVAAGLNEFAGYAAVGITALLTAYLATTFGIRPVPVLDSTVVPWYAVGVVAVAAGLALSAALVRETRPYARLEAGPAPPGSASFRSTFAEASWRDRSLFACSQGGLVTNLNDGVAWGLLPLFLAARGLPTASIGVVVGLYPVAWGVLQLVTGPASDVVGRKPMIVVGMWAQAAGFLLFILGGDLTTWSVASLVVGAGTAMVYPTYLSAVSGLARPEARGATVGVYRFWRDFGFAIGAVVVGFFADFRGLEAALALTGGLTFASGVVVWVALRETRAPREGLGAPRPRDGTDRVE